MKVLSIKNVKKIYKTAGEETHALDDISYDIEEGSVITVLGPSGSGKSTMLNVLSGIDRVSEGEILFNESSIVNLKDKELTKYRRDNLGFIFQSYNLVSSLTVYENVEFGGHLSKEALDINEILDMFELSDMKYKFPYQLSGGQMQRVAIARAIVKNPKILFCDEPTGALDEKVGKKVLKLLQDINKKYNTTIIIVTHNPALKDMGNMVVHMNSGKITNIENNEEIKDAESLGWA